MAPSIGSVAVSELCYSSVRHGQLSLCRFLCVVPDCRLPVAVAECVRSSECARLRRHLQSLSCCKGCDEDGGCGWPLEVVRWPSQE